MGYEDNKRANIVLQQHTVGLLQGSCVQPQTDESDSSTSIRRRCSVNGRSLVFDSPVLLGFCLVTFRVLPLEIKDIAGQKMGPQVVQRVICLSFPEVELDLDGRERSRVFLVPKTLRRWKEYLDGVNFEPRLRLGGGRSR